MSNDYYVYMYIDPRNNEEFYYGKGKGRRKFSHLKGKSDTEKNKRIKAIKKAGEEPIIKVIGEIITKMGRVTIRYFTIFTCIVFRLKNCICVLTPEVTEKK